MNKKSSKQVKSNKAVKTVITEHVPQKSFLRRLSPFHRLVAAEVVIGALAIGFIIFYTRAATTVTTSPTPTSSVAQCGKTVANYSYKVPFGDSPWNTPVCNLPLFAKDKAVAENFGKRFYEYATAWNASSQYWQDRVPEQKGKIMTQFGLAGDEQDYSTPIYHANASTPKRQFKMCNADSCYPSNLDSAACVQYDNVDCMAPNTAIPYEPSWRASGDADGNPSNNAFDKEMIIIDDTTGYSYELWGVDPYGGTCFAGRTLWYSLSNKNPDSRVCVASVRTLRDKDGKQASIYSYNQGVVDGRGLGIQNTAMIVTPEEVQAGEIRHALTMEIFTAMYGPDCGAQIGKTVDASIVNKTCGYAVAPAGKFEWRAAKDVSRLEQCQAQADQLANFTTKQTFRQLLTPDKTIPEGMRFKLVMTDAQLDTWINSRADLKADPQKAKTARIFAVALRDYGWIPGDQTCYGAGITIAGSANPDAKAKWASLGIKDASSQNLLDGLFKADNIQALDPPVNTCLDGTTTQFYCQWVTSKYINASTQPTNTIAPTSTPSPQITPTPVPSATSRPSLSPTPTPNQPAANVDLPAPKQVGVYKDTWVCVFCRTTISWATVVGASSYQVKIDGYAYSTTSPQYDMYGFFYIQDPVTVEVAAIDKNGKVSKNTIFRRLR